MTTDVSVVIPVYGSAAILPRLVEALHAILAPAQGEEQFEVILVDDRGPDNAWEAIGTLAATRPWLKGVRLRRNVGQHNAILTGLRYARGRVVVMMDDDLQHNPADIPALMAQIDVGYDVCYSHFRRRNHALWKRIGSAFNAAIARRLLGKPRDLYLSPFKAVNEGIRDELLRFEGPHVYLDGLILSLTDNITSIELDHHDRADGLSGYGLRKSISLWLKMATNFSLLPLRLASLAGMIFSGVGFLAAVALVVQRFTSNVMPVGWSSLIVSILILGGVQLLALGLIGEYVGRVLLHVSGKPQAVVGSTLNLPGDE